MKNAEKTPETLRFSGVFLVPYYTIPKIKRELKPAVTHEYLEFGLNNAQN